jgi:hypothetical protein
MVHQFIYNKNIKRFTTGDKRRMKMPTKSKRISITIFPELETDLDVLKKEKFYKESQSEMLRYLIKLGLQVNKEKVYKNE